MKYLFADTANLNEIKKLYSLGIINGVTTNPSIIAKEPKQNFEALIDEIWEYCSKRDLSLSIEVFTDSIPDMVFQAKEITGRLLKIVDRKDLLHIKVPIGTEEISVIQTLSRLNINVNCTCCYTSEQMILAGLAGAKYVSIFYNRLKDIGGDPHHEITKVKALLNENKLACNIIAGSIRKPTDLSEAWSAGTDIVTCSPEIIYQSLFHEKSLESANQFLNDFSSWMS